MDNIEQLKQDNAKLTERLNNAAKFFREQKAQIESLTKENEQLKNDNNVKDDSIRLNNELLETVENLKKENEELEKKIKEQQDFEANNINKVVPELEGELSKYKNTTELLNKSIDELNNTIDSKDQAYSVLQNTYNELFGENTKLKEDLENRIKQIRATEKTYDEEQKKIIAARDEFITKYNQSKEIIEQLKKDNKESEEAAKKVMNSYEKDLNTYKAKEIELTNKLDESIKNNKELQDKYDNLDKICNDFENQKLAWEGDYQGLAEMYHQLQKEYDRLSNQTDIYSQSDTTLAEIVNLLTEKGLVNKTDISPKTPIKESGTSHRMGDNLEGGKNVGV